MKTANGGGKALWKDKELIVDNSERTEKFIFSNRNFNRYYCFFSVAISYSTI